MSRRAQAAEDGPGQDSFLDIVANLVGIMIILVTVIGVRARGEMGRAAPKLSLPHVSQQDVQVAVATARGLEVGNRKLENRIQRQHTEIRYRKSERDKKLQLVAALENELARKRETLGENEQALFDLQQTIGEAQSELQKISSQVSVLERDEEQVEVVQHLPTPMAKTVFGQEVHFRLAGGRITYVPWSELLERLKTDARENVWKLKNADSVTETLGPIRNFMMKYTLVTSTYSTETRVGSAVQNRVELESFELFPIEDRGEPIAQALQRSSEFNAVLANYTPGRTTVTIWVYPDSYEHFRHLQKSLYDRGFLSAARPMPDGTPIGGSPQGTRSAAQ